MSTFLLVQTSIDTKEGAQMLASAIVSKRLAACCWISGPISSTYWWKGNMEQAEEWVCQFKTHDELYEELERTIRAIHPYEVPEIVATPITAGSQNFLQWILDETGKPFID